MSKDNIQTTDDYHEINNSEQGVAHVQITNYFHRQIIQIFTLPNEFPGRYPKTNYEIFCLCNDGTIWKRMDVGESIYSWALAKYDFPPIPQVKE